MLLKELLFIILNFIEIYKFLTLQNYYNFFRHIQRYTLHFADVTICNILHICHYTCTQ